MHHEEHNDSNNNKTSTDSHVDTSRIALENKAINNPLLTASLNSPPVVNSAVDLTAPSGNLQRKRAMVNRSEEASSSTCNKEMYANLLMQLRHQGITASEESVVVTNNNNNSKMSAAARKEKLKSQLCFQCPVCKKRFQRHIAMNAHFQAEHLGGTPKVHEKVCKLCAFVGTDMMAIRTHLLTKHNIDLETPTACLVEPERSLSPLPSSSSDSKKSGGSKHPAVSIIRTSVVPKEQPEITTTGEVLLRSSPPVNVVLHDNSYLIKEMQENSEEAKDLSIKTSLTKRCASASPGLDLVQSSKKRLKSSNRIVMSSPSSPLNQEHVSSPSAPANLTSQWQCQHCSIIFPDQTLYFLHRGFHSNPNPWKCNGCGQRCTDMYDFNTHLMSDVHH